MISISSGFIKGLALRSPQGTQTRPSSERLRQGTFNILRNFRWPDAANILDNAAIADLFAGSGAWGLDALSNGARLLQCIESHKLALKSLESNIKASLSALSHQNLGGLEPEVELFSETIEEAYAKLLPCRVIFSDPPYKVGWFTKIMALEARHDRMETGGVFLFEAQAKEVIVDAAGLQAALEAKYILFNEKNYGDSTVYFFIKKARNDL